MLFSVLLINELIAAHGRFTAPAGALLVNLILSAGCYAFTFGDPVHIVLLYMLGACWAILLFFSGALMKWRLT